VLKNKLRCLIDEESALSFHDPVITLTNLINPIFAGEEKRNRDVEKIF